MREFPKTFFTFIPGTTDYHRWERVQESYARHTGVVRSKGEGTVLAFAYEAGHSLPDGTPAPLTNPTLEVVPMAALRVHATHPDSATTLRPPWVKEPTKPFAVIDTGNHVAIEGESEPGFYVVDYWDTEEEAYNSLGIQRVRLIPTEPAIYPKKLPGWSYEDTLLAHADLDLLLSMFRGFLHKEELDAFAARLIGIPIYPNNVQFWIEGPAIEEALEVLIKTLRHRMTQPGIIPELRKAAKQTFARIEKDLASIKAKAQ